MTVTTITITDVTRMSGTRVCLAGVTDAGVSIRPEFEHVNINEDWLYQANVPIIKPFSRIRLDLLIQRSSAPHTEDWLIRQNFRQVDRDLTEQERIKFLNKINDKNVENIFGAQIKNDLGFYISEGEGNRSLGTICEVGNIRVAYSFFNDKWDYRISFSDQSGKNYRLAVTDLAFRYYVDYLRQEEKLTIPQINDSLTAFLKNSSANLRIGLARPTWQLHPHCCFLQVNGIYSFPDYLSGKSFADFRPRI